MNRIRSQEDKSNIIRDRMKKSVEKDKLYSRRILDIQIVCGIQNRIECKNNNLILYVVNALSKRGQINELKKCYKNRGESKVETAALRC